MSGTSGWVGGSRPYDLRCKVPAMKLETIIYEERNNVAWITLNRPEVLNAFNRQMQVELRETWRALRENDDVNAVVVAAAGEKAFCTGIDRTETMGDEFPPKSGKT